MIFEVKCDLQLPYKEQRTHGPDAHTYCLLYSTIVPLGAGNHHVLGKYCAYTMISLDEDE